MPNWQEFERRKQVAEPNKGAEDFTALCARVLTSADGKALLAHLYRIYVDHRAPAQAPEAFLREAEAKRQVVFDLERARDEGLNRAPKPSA